MKNKKSILLYIRRDTQVAIRGLPTKQLDRSAVRGFKSHSLRHILQSVSSGSLLGSFDAK